RGLVEILRRLLRVGEVLGDVRRGVVQVLLRVFERLLGGFGLRLIHFLLDLGHVLARHALGHLGDRLGLIGEALLLLGLSLLLLGGLLLLLRRLLQRRLGLVERVLRQPLQ